MRKHRDYFLNFHVISHHDVTSCNISALLIYIPNEMLLLKLIYFSQYTVVKNSTRNNDFEITMTYNMDIVKIAE